MEVNYGIFNNTINTNNIFIRSAFDVSMGCLNDFYGNFFLQIFYKTYKKPIDRIDKIGYTIIKKGGNANGRQNPKDNEKP